MVPTLLVSSLLVFVLMDLAPGDPIYNRFGNIMGVEDRAALTERFGLDDPLLVRYVRFLGDLLRGDLGFALVSGQRISDLIAGALPVTIMLAGTSLLLALAISVVLGLFGGLTAGTPIDGGIRVWAIGAIAAPEFWTGLLAINIFAVALGWFPAGGYVSISSGVLPWARALALPVLTLSLPVSGVLTRVVRTAVAEELDRDYVRTALGLGLPMHRVLTRHVLPNAIASPITVLGLYFGYLLAGAVLVETVYALPGMGRLLVQAALRVDSFTVRAVALVTVALFLLANFLADVLRLIVNPRLR